MKKYLLGLFFVALFFANHTKAQTAQGRDFYSKDYNNYKKTNISKKRRPKALIGVNASRIQAKYIFRDKFKNPDNDEYNGRGRGNTDYGYGVNFQYRVNLNSPFFIGQELFYDKLDLFLQDQNATKSEFGYSQKDGLTLQSRMGYKINFGYDFTYRFSGFLSVGQARVKWKDTVNNNSPDYSDNTFSRHDHSTSFIYGVGASYDLDKYLTISSSFDYQSFTIPHLRIDKPGFEGTEGYIRKVNLKVIKIGLSYRF